MATARPLRIAHVSDVHITTSGIFEPESWEAGVAAVNAAEPDVVVLSGDHTDWGLRSEWEIVRERLRDFTAPLVTCLGNHDARREGWRVYEEMFGCNRYYARKVRDVDFVVLDSSQPDLDDGEIGREQRGWMRDRLREAEFPVVVLHHHLVPIPNTGRETNICRDAGGVLKVLDEFEVPLVLGGHRHMPWAWRLNGTLLAHAGTFSSNKRQMPPSYNWVEVGRDRIRVELVKFMTDERTPVAEVEPPARWGGREQPQVAQVHEAGI